MKSFLYTQPPSQLKFFPVKPGVYAARGTVTVMNKPPRGMPDIDLYRFDFYLGVEKRAVTRAAFIVDELRSLGSDEIRSWHDERQSVRQMHDILMNGESVSIQTYEDTLKCWTPSTNHTFEKIKSAEDLRSSFVTLMEIDYEIRHYFETEWLILTDGAPLSIDFRGAFAGG